MAKESYALLQKRADKIFAILSGLNPHPETELHFTNHFTLLVAVVLSAQATDAGVNKATPALFTIANTPEKMAALGVERLEGYIKTIGLYKAKAKNVIALSRMLVEEYGSRVPDKHEDLMRLPGVGRKTANVILNCAFGQPTMAVDTHVFRLAHRLGFSRGKTPEAVEQDLLKVIPEKWMQHAHYWLILHGRYVCKARAPKCAECAIADYCPSAFAI
ncbi:endonuclease III [bacterium]|nr:endonuclease III [bacterium]